MILCKICNKVIPLINKIFCSIECRNYNKLEKPVCKFEGCDNLTKRYDRQFCSRKCCNKFRIIYSQKYCILCEAEIDSRTKSFCRFCKFKYEYLYKSKKYELEQLKTYIKTNAKYCNKHRIFYYTFCSSCRLEDNMNMQKFCKDCGARVSKKKIRCRMCLKIYIKKKYKK